MSEQQPEDREFLYVGVFRVKPQEDARAVHKAFIDALKATGRSEHPGHIAWLEFEPDPVIACDPANEGKYVMASHCDALVKLGIPFEFANRLIPVVSENPRPSADTEGSAG